MTDSMLKNILERATQSEEHSYNLYKHLASKVEKPESRKMLEGLAEQELRHKEMLESFDPDEATDVESVKIEDQKLTEFLEPTPLDPSATIQDVMLFAMKKEQSAHEFYARMSEFSPTAEAKSLFDRLAVEELKHKTSLETLYEDMFMREN
jgi:rubrerythrin